MLKYSTPFFLAVGLSLALTPLSARLGLRIGAIDEPDKRRIHAVAKPRFGGPAILLALVLAVVFAGLLDSSLGAMLWSQSRKLGPLVVAALVVMFVGAVDDVRPLRPITKLLVEIGAASVAVYAVSLTSVCGRTRRACFSS